MKNCVIIGLVVLVVLLNTKVSVNVINEDTGEKVNTPITMSLFKNLTGIDFSIELVKEEKRNETLSKQLSR